MRKVKLVVFATLLSLVGLHEARADFIGAYAQGQVGSQTTNRTTHAAVGAAAGVYLMGFELYADLRFLREPGDLGNDLGMWNQAGVRFGLGLPVPGVDVEVFAGLAYVYSEIADEDVDPTDPEDPTRYRGLNPHIGGRLDMDLFPFVSAGFQLESGYHYMLPNDYDYSSGPNFGGMFTLKISI